MSKTLLQVLCGLPGSGKSTWAAKQLDNVRRPRLRVFSLDKVRTEGRPAESEFALVEGMTRSALCSGLDVLVDMCSLNDDNRLAMLKLGRQRNARCELVIVETPALTCHARDARRGALASHFDWTLGPRTFELLKRHVADEGWDGVTVVPGW